MAQNKVMVGSCEHIKEPYGYTKGNFFMRWVTTSFSRWSCTMELVNPYSVELKTTAEPSNKSITCSTTASTSKNCCQLFLCETLPDLFWIL